MKKLLTLLLLLLLVGCEEQDNELKVITTLFPQYDIVEHIAPEVANELIISAGLSPHAFEPSPTMVAEILEADVVFYTSELVEPWIEKLIGQSDTVFVDLSEGIEYLYDDHDHEEEHVDEEAIDPHYWTDPINLLHMIDIINDTLTELGVDTSSSLESYRDDINDLHNDLVDFFAQYEEPIFIQGGHNAFGYFANRYSLEYVTAYEGFSTETEPTPQAIIELIDVMETYEVNIIYSDSFVSEHVAEALASEVGAEVRKLNVGSNLTEEERELGVTLIELYRNNLDELKEGVVDGHHQH